MHRLIVSTCFVSALAMAGCSKTADEPTTGTDANSIAEAKPGSAATADVNPHLNSALSSVTSEIEAKQYDAAVQRLLEAKIAAEASEADRWLYQQKYREAQEALRQKAETDPQAKASYEALGRATMGR